MNEEAKEFSKLVDWSKLGCDTEVTCLCGLRRRGKGKGKYTAPIMLVAEKPCPNCGSFLLVGIHHDKELFTIG